MRSVQIPLVLANVLRRFTFSWVAISQFQSVIPSVPRLMTGPTEPIWFHFFKSHNLCTRMICIHITGHLTASSKVASIFTYFVHFMDLISSQPHITKMYTVGSKKTSELKKVVYFLSFLWTHAICENGEGGGEGRVSADKWGDKWRVEDKGERRGVQAIKKRKGTTVGRRAIMRHGGKHLKVQIRQNERWEEEGLAVSPGR